MDTECKTKFTKVTLTDPADQTKEYQYDADNTPAIVIADHTKYFSAIQTKNACKIKSCTWALNTNGAADTANAAAFEVTEIATKWTWKIKKLDVANGKVYPDYKMKCIIDINLGGNTPTTTDKFGDKVVVK